MESDSKQTVYIEQFTSTTVDPCSAAHIAAHHPARCIALMAKILIVLIGCEEIEVMRAFQSVPP